MLAYLRGFMALKSVVVGLAILALWGRSYFVGDQVRRGSDTQWIQLGSASGSTIVTFGHDGQATRLTGATWHYVASRDPRRMLHEVGLDQDSVVHRLGFGFRRDMIYEPVRGMVVDVVIPHWLVFVLAMPSAVLWVWRKSRPTQADKPDPVAADRYDGMWECPSCGQTYARPPTFCAICGEQLGAQEFV